MAVTVRSFAKINLSLRIGARRPDGFHELRTVYQTVALHDLVRVHAATGTGIEIRCDDPRVPTGPTNTCHRIARLTMDALRARGGVVIEMEKRVPVQGGLGGASANAVATMLALERVLRKSLSAEEKMRIAAEVGSDLPLFLIGGTVLGVGRGEEVYPLPELPAIPCVIATPEIGVSTPQAFADWDTLSAAGKLTPRAGSDKINELGREVSAWLSSRSRPRRVGRASSGVPAGGRGRAEILLLDLVHTGIANDFEPVVFSKHPELREVKAALERAGAMYASLSGSGSAVYGLFRGGAAAKNAAVRLRKTGTAAAATSTLTRSQYWRKFPVSGF